MVVRLADGTEREVEAGASALDIAQGISGKLAKRALAARVNGELRDLTAPLTDGDTVEILTFDDEDGRRTVWHSASHVMAQAVQRLFPGTKIAIGPSTETGFYYDFDPERPFTNEDLEAIEKEMRSIVAEDLPIEREVVSREQALSLMRERNEPYKVELIEGIPEGEQITLRRQGDFVDLCSGPHVPSTGRVKVPKLLRTAGAYWRGDEKNKMLNRIYGVAYPSQKEVDEHLKRLKEAEERDHNKLGRELHYFTTSALVGQGLPLIMPKGARVMQILQRFVEDEEEKRGYVLTKTPYMAKNDLYKISGHWDHYKDGMFVLTSKEGDSEVLALRPMTCPFQYEVYNAQHHSYKDLPVRMGETSTLFRNEASGEMHGLIRVRQFTLAEGHIVCTPEQLEDEFLGVLDLVQFMMRTLGIQDDVTYRFSKWDPNDRDKYIGDEAVWESTQDAMRQILDHAGIEYTEAAGEAAFYGPKLDVQFRNVFGKEDTIITIQIDFSLAGRFNMYYVDADGQKKTPYIIHRSSIGCYERTLAMLIEKYAGALPLWMMSEQVRIMNITDASAEYCRAYVQRLRDAGIRATFDDRQEKIGYKIRAARTERIPYMLIAGEKEIGEGTFSVRKRGEGEVGSMGANEFLDLVVRQTADKVIF